MGLFSTYLWIIGSRFHGIIHFLAAYICLTSDYFEFGYHALGATTSIRATSGGDL